MQEHLNDWPFDGDDGPYTMRVDGNLRCSNSEMIYEMCAAGVGIARLAEFVVARDLAAGRLVQLLAAEARTDSPAIYAVYPTRRHLSPKVRAFIDFLVEALKAPPG